MILCLIDIDNIVCMPAFTLVLIDFPLVVAHSMQFEHRNRRGKKIQASGMWSHHDTIIMVQYIHYLVALKKTQPERESLSLLNRSTNYCQSYLTDK